MTVYETDARQALGYGLAALVALLGLSIGSAAGFAALPKSGWSFALVVGMLAGLAAAGWLGYALYGIAHTTYALDRNAVVIRWGGVRDIIPMGEVQRVINGTDVQAGLRFIHLPLPGWWHGTGRHPQLGRIRFYSTAPLADQVIIITPEMNYAVSPYDLDAFLDAFRVRFEMGPTQAVTRATLQPAFFQSALWNDRAARVTSGLAAALYLITIGLALWLYPSVPERVALHYGSNGAPDRFGGPDQLIVLVGVGFLWLALNAGVGVIAHSKQERLAAYLLWGGGVVIQLLFLAAVITIATANS